MSLLSKRKIEKSQPSIASFLYKRTKEMELNNDDVNKESSDKNGNGGIFSNVRQEKQLGIDNGDNNTNKSKKSASKYNTKWESKYDWIYYDNIRGGAFCKYCETFLRNDAEVMQKCGGIFITVPFTNYRKALGKSGKLEKHSNSEKHSYSVSMEKIRIQGKEKPIHTILINESGKQKDENRRNISALIEAIYFLAKEEIPHTTKYEALVKKILIKRDDVLNMWIKNQSSRSTYISKASGSEFIENIGKVLDEHDSSIVVKNKYFSLMADESTNINNISELTILVRFVDNHNIREMFLCLVQLDNLDAETITRTILCQLQQRNIPLKYLVSCSFDGAATFSGCISGVHKRLSAEAGRPIPYIHCRAHILSLALTSARNKHPSIKRVVHVVKDIYKLFHKSSKREKMLHDVQSILEAPILKIPEAIDIRWLSHFRSINAVKLCYNSIMMTCEHIHKDGADLASLAGGILLEMEQSGFLINFCVLHEALFCVSNLSKILQKRDLCLSSLPSLISGTIDHLENVSRDCLEKNEQSTIWNNYNLMRKNLENIRPIQINENVDISFKSANKFVKSMISQMTHRFNDQAMLLIKSTSRLESFESFQTLTEQNTKELSAWLHLDFEALWNDIRSFKYVISSENDLTKSEDNISKLILKSNIGYSELKTLCIKLGCIPVSTASAERSFSAMNRLMTKLRNRLQQETLQHLMKIAIEGPDQLSDNLIDSVIDKYAMKKQRRLRLI